MPKCLQPALLLYLRLLEPLTSKRGYNSDPNQALLTQDPLVQEAVELPEGKVSMARDTSQTKAPSKKRFAQINGKHYHPLETSNLRKSLSQWDRVRD